MRTETFRIAILHHNLWTAGSGHLLFGVKAHLEVAATITYIRYLYQSPTPQLQEKDSYGSGWQRKLLIRRLTLPLLGVGISPKGEGGGLIRSTMEKDLGIYFGKMVRTPNVHRCGSRIEYSQGESQVRELA